MKLAPVLLVIFAVACGYATIIENESGTIAARALVYNALWFEIVMGLLALNLIFMLARWRNFKPRHFGFILIHVAMIVIILGAGITRYMGYEGSMHIREGDSAGTMLSREDYVQLRVENMKAGFMTRLYRPGQSLSRKLEMGGTTFQVTVEDFWPHFEEKWTEGKEGQPLLKFLTVREGHQIPVTLVAQDEARAGDISFWYISQEMMDTFTIEPLGEMAIQIGQHQSSQPVSGKVPLKTELGGYSFVITEFHTDFKVGQEPGQDRLLNNPMIKVQITAPDGGQEERMLFAFHPDFAMQHSGRSEVFKDINLIYKFERKIFFAGSGQEVIARSSLPLVLAGENMSGDGEVISPGTVFPVSVGSQYSSPGKDFSFTLQLALAKAVMAPSLSDNPDAPAAARIRITRQGVEGAAAVVIRGKIEPVVVEVSGQSIGLSYGRREIILPYRLHLEDFILKSYPGSDKPAGYESHVLLFDQEKGITGRPVRIYMNHPLTHRNFKHFQSSYDRDGHGTILSVNYDPGKIPTYFGYTMITLGIILVLIKDLVWPRKSKRKTSLKKGLS